MAMKRSARKILLMDELCRRQDQFEKLKASIRAKVEHPFHVVKNLFRQRKVRYRGLAKNEAQLFTLFGLTNLVLARRKGCRCFRPEVCPVVGAEGENDGERCCEGLRRSEKMLFLWKVFTGAPAKSPNAG
jgi:hypothetical protein